MNAQVKMPVLFIGHGSPMNAIAHNDYTHTLSRVHKNIPRPKAIVMISAHWMTKGTYVTSMPHPQTIHDFYGFPKELFAIEYKADGNPKLAHELMTKIKDPLIAGDNTEWGLDHGSWSVLRHLYPKADIPVIQLSMDMSKPPEFHYNLGKKLRFLREEGVLIIGSGNIVHNLRQIDWNENAKAHDYAIAFDQWVKENAMVKNFNPLVFDFDKSEMGKLSHPTPDHYYPLLYTLGAVEESDELSFLFEGIQNASISMRSFQWSSNEGR